jgi:dUTP pyrophosphatase
MRVKVTNTNCLPNRAHPTDAGADLVAAEITFMDKGVRTLVKTGVFIEIPMGYVGLLFPRSSLSKLDITMTNSVGVIDSDYRGEIMASLMYNGNQPNYFIQQYSKIVQLVIVPIALPEFVIVKELQDTVRGTGGFGSTG